MKLKKPGRSETSIETSIKNALETRFGLQSKKFRTIADNAAPDRIVLVPGGFVFFLEVKRPKKHMTKLQLEYQARLRSEGFVDEEVHSVEEAVAAYQKFLGIMRARGIRLDIRHYDT